MLVSQPSFLPKSIENECLLPGIKLQGLISIENMVKKERS
jgi:hypothetical protein